MRRYILTGAPGSGKTAILRRLETEGYAVVEEAATDVIALSQAQGVAEPWLRVDFIDAVARLQRLRLDRASREPGQVQFHDRSVVCTQALAAYLGFPASDTLARELERIGNERTFERSVFFLQNLGFVAPTAARRISFAESMRFERIHEETYRAAGYDLVFIVRGTLEERVAAILAALHRLGHSRESGLSTESGA